MFAHSIGRLTQLWEPLRKHASEQSAALNSGGGGPAPGSAEEDPNAIPPALMGVPSGPGAPVLLGDASVSMASSTAGGNHGAGAQVEDVGNSPGGAKSSAGSQNGGELGAGGGGGASGKAFARLNTALQQSASHKAEKALRKAIETQDLRAKITVSATYLFAFELNGRLLSHELTGRRTNGSVRSIFLSCCCCWFGFSLPPWFLR